MDLKIFMSGKEVKNSDVAALEQRQQHALAGPGMLELNSKFFFCFALVLDKIRVPTGPLSAIILTP